MLIENMFSLWIKNHMINFLHMEDLFDLENWSDKCDFFIINHEYYAFLIEPRQANLCLWAFRHDKF